MIYKVLLLLFSFFLFMPQTQAGAVFPPEGPCNDGDTLVYKGDHVGCKAPVTIPSGLVAAFSSASCPTGWTFVSELSGRVIVGVGSGAGLTYRSLGSYGGEEMHALTLSEIPSHSHDYYDYTPEIPWDGNYGIGPGSGHHRYNAYRTSFSSGGSQAHNIMQPWYSLLFCKKN